MESPGGLRAVCMVPDGRSASGRKEEEAGGENAAAVFTRTPTSARVGQEGDRLEPATIFVV